MTYCNDVDLLHWEPNLFADAAAASQLLLTGSGTLAGTTFTLSAGSLADAHIHEGQVIVLSGAVNGCFPILSIDSPTTLTLSVLYDGLADPGSAVPTSPGDGSSLTFNIRTFWPQRQIVAEVLRSLCGIGAGTTRPAASILTPSTLKRASVLGTLQMIYSALAAAATEPAKLIVRAELYERLYKRALERTRVEIDLDGDGEPEMARTLGVGTFTRRY